MKSLLKQELAIAIATAALLAIVDVLNTKANKDKDK